MLNTDREEESVRHNLHPLPPLFSQNNVRQRAHGKENLRSVDKSYYFWAPSPITLLLATSMNDGHT